MYHVHGVWFDSDSVILCTDDYTKSQYDFEYTMGKLFFETADANQHRSLLFLGSKLGMVDEHFCTLYTDPRFNHLRHFALLKEGGLRELLDNPKFLAAVQNDRLIPIVFGEHNDDLGPFLGQLSY